MFASSHLSGRHLYLASDESSFVNGTDIVVDGGAIGGRRFSEVMVGGQATRALLE